MPSPIENEIIGDWNNLKGTEYHLVYALWLLIFRKVPFVAFYQGNDLLAHPIGPPIVQSTQAVVSLHVQQQQEDEWIQLKATEETWTPTILLQDNLLANFLYNALSSEHEGRAWRIRLITQALVQEKEVGYFIDHHTEKPKLSTRFNNIISEVQQRWQNEGWGSLDETHLRALGFTILRRLAETKPVRLETLKAQIEAQIAYEYPDPEAVRLIADALRGALLRDAALGPENAPIYTADWVDRVAQRPLLSRALLTSNPTRACTEAVNTTLPSTWATSHFVPRPRLESALQQFLAARETLFILIGMSGVGKSWMMADWVINRLKEHIRLLVRGSELYNYRELNTLVAAKLRRFAPDDWSDEEYLQRFRAASVREHHVLPVIVIDDLHFPLSPGDVSHFIHYLGRLIAQCHEHGIKVVLTCQKPIWDTHSYLLRKEILPRDLFALEAEMKLPSTLEGGRTQDLYSFLLSDLTPEELKEVLKQRLPATDVDLAFLHLQSPEFVSLRNPYLLNLYLQQYGMHLSEPDEVPTLVRIDALLDQRVHDSLLDTAHNVGCDATDTEHAFHALQRLLWTERPGGLTSTQTIQCLSTHVPELGNAVLRELRRGGLLTTESPLHLAEPIIAARLFAKDLKDRMLQGEDIFVGLRPGADDDAVSALLRTIPDPVLMAENLLERDLRWLPAITNGLAQVTQDSPEDYKALAFLSTLAKVHIGPETYHALGQLAARGRRAWEWVTDMYLSDRIMERFRGGWALATTMDFVPDRVEKVLQQRLEKAAHIDDSQREKREKWLQDALSPLHKINNNMAAHVGLRLIQQYSHLVRSVDSRLSHDFLKDLDEIRGQIALWSSSGELDHLLTELQAEDSQTRYRAACSLRPLTFEHPELVQEALCEAIRREKDAGVMNRLLWVVYRIGEIAPEALLKAIEASFAIDWEKAPTTTGIALALLSDMADQNPSRVFQLLPKSLDAYEWWTRALLSEMLVYAWWCCAEHIPDTRANLKAHTKPDIAAIPDEYRIFALRGSAIALMGMMCLDMAIPSNELSGKQASYPLGTLLFFYLNGDDFTRRHRQAFQNHPQFEQLRASLQACVYEEERISVHPFQKELSNARYLCARSCREILRNFDGDETWVAQREHQESIIYAVFRLFGTGRDAEFMQLVKASPHDLLGLLETSIRDDALLPTFYYWKEETHSWYSLLIARVYARMFNVNPIGDAEAYELCEQMLVAMSALPDGSERRAYEAIYGAIAHQLKGDISPLPLLPAPKGLLQNAHAYALSILQRAHEQQEATWIADALDDRRGWWDTTRFQLNDQSHSLGDHKYFLYVFPAVRLAFITAGKRYTWDDPASQFMKARVQVNKLQEEHWRVFRNDPPVGRDRLQKALAIFNEQLERFPHDERLWQSCANLLLRLGRCQEAKNLLLHCLSMSSCSQDTQADAYYDLACVYAKMGNEDECRHMLQVSIQYRPLNQLSCNWLIHDPDLESVREKAWFRALQQAQG